LLFKLQKQTTPPPPIHYCFITIYYERWLTIARWETT